jgi:hypothetical protein
LETHPQPSVRQHVTAPTAGPSLVDHVDCLVCGVLFDASRRAAGSRLPFCGDCFERLPATPAPRLLAGLVGPRGILGLGACGHCGAWFRLRRSRGLLVNRNGGWPVCPTCSDAIDIEARRRGLV